MLIPKSSGFGNQTLSFLDLSNAQLPKTIAFDLLGTAAEITTRSTFKIEDPSRSPGRVGLWPPGEGFGIEGTPKPKIQRDPSPPFKRKPCMWAAAVHDAILLVTFRVVAPGSI